MLHPFLILLTAGLFAGATARAEGENLVDKIKFSGSGRVRFENQQFTGSLTNSQAFTSLRLRPNLTFNASKQLELVVEPQFAKRLGGDVYVPSSATGNTLTETSGNTQYAGDAATIFQGYLGVNFDEHFSLRAGRQALKYGDEYIVGPANWGVYGRSFDAVTARWQNAGSFVDLIYGVVADAGTRAVDGDRELDGIYTSWSIGGILKTVEAYYFVRDDKDNRVTASAASDTGGANRYTVGGARVMLDYANFALNFEWARGGGSREFIADGSDAEMYVGYFGYSFSPTHRVGLEVDHAGKNWNELYPTTNRMLGRKDVLGRRNLEAYVLKYAADLNEQFGLEFDAYHFERHANDARVYQTNGTTAFGSTTDRGVDLGNELDLAVRFKQTPTIAWSVSYSKFFNGGYLRKTLEEADLPAGRNPEFYYVMLETKF